MKIIIVGKKQLGLYMILIGLMVILFSADNWFQANLKYTALLQSDISSFKTYQDVNNKFSYDLPSEWKANIRKSVSSEINYQNEFISNDSEISGMIQTWISQSNLKIFIKRNSVMEQNQNVITNYTFSKLTIDKHDSFVVDYSMLNSQKVNYRCEEYYIKMDKGIIKYSFYVRSKDFKENIPLILKGLVSTLQVQ